MSQTSVQATPTAALSAVISHSPSHKEDGGGSSNRNIDSLSIGVGGSAALLVLTIVLVTLVTVLVYLRRKNNKLSTTENVAYLYSKRAITTNSLTPLYPYTSTSSDINHTQNGVCNGHTSSNDVTDTCIPTFTNQAYLEVSKNGCTSNTDIPTSANVAYLEDGPVYEDTNIPTSTNQSYLKRSSQSGSDTFTYDYIHT